MAESVQFSVTCEWTGNWALASYTLPFITNINRGRKSKVPKISSCHAVVLMWVVRQRLGHITDFCLFVYLYLYMHRGMGMVLGTSPNSALTSCTYHIAGLVWWGMRWWDPTTRPASLHIHKHINQIFEGHYGQDGKLLHCKSWNLPFSVISSQPQ